MMSTHLQKNRGFTLIETLIYLVLFGMIITGALTSVYTVFESSAHNQTSAMLEEEGSFLLAKVDWALSSASGITSPSSSGSTLSLSRYDGVNVLISSSGANMQIQKNGGPLQTLNNTNVSVGNLSFVHTKGSSDGINPESVQASFTVYATTSNGFPLSKSFSTMKYLRK